MIQKVSQQKQAILLEKIWKQKLRIYLEQTIQNTRFIINSPEDNLQDYKNL